MPFFLRSLLVCFLVAAVPVSASAQTAIDEDSSSRRAVRQGHEALRLFSQGNYGAAARAFERADELAHSPVFVLYQARAERRIGNLLRARELLRACAREEVDRGTPAAWREAVADAARELDALRGRIPTVRLRISGGASFPVTVSARGRSLVMNEPEIVWEVDPGVHPFDFVDEEGNRVSVELLLREGQSRVPVRAEFPRVRPTSALSAPDDPRELPEASRPPPRPYRRGAHAAFLVSGGAYIFTTVAATMAWQKARRLKKNCVGSSCRPRDQHLAIEARRWANLATAGFATGTVGAALGVGLLVYPTPGGAQVGLVASY